MTTQFPGSIGLWLWGMPFQKPNEIEGSVRFLRRAGYFLVGAASGSAYSDAGQFVVDGDGNGTVVSVANTGGTVSHVTGSGTYTVAKDCTGTAQVNNQNGSLNYQFAIAKDGQVALFFGLCAGIRGTCRNC
jgi:hypothetical protein